MSVLVVGGDHLGNIPAKLGQAGFTRILHVSGRKTNHLFMDIPDQVDYVLVLVDYVNHGLAGIIKEKCRNSGKKAIFARRAWSHIAQALTREVN